MTRLRILIVSTLAILPIAFLVGVGMYHLWVTGWAFWAWWPMGLSLALAYILAWRWQKQFRLRHDQAPPALHWTDRDRLAWRSVEKRVSQVNAVGDDKLGEPQFYFDTAQELAKELALVYRPGATDPVGIVTVPEILTVVEMAAQDLNEMARNYVPGSHLMTVDNWRTARQAVGWYRTAANAYWLGSAVLDPINTAARYLAAKYGMGKPLELLQQNLIRWFFSAYVQKLGFYLIELYSGRLRVGAQRYRELMAAYTTNSEDSPRASPVAPDVVDKPPSTAVVVEPVAIKIAVVGQVKAGKSSLINALLGERQAATDVLPLTAKVTKYDLAAPGTPTRLQLFDTVGYGRSGLDEDALEETAETVQSCDLVLMVAHVRNPARKADVDFLAGLGEWFRNRPHLRFPPVLVVLTHVDLLTPALEWTPPYNWRTGERSKERSMAEAVTAARGDFPEAEAFVPSCTAAGREWGISDGVLPIIVNMLGEAKAVALLRCLHAEADEGKIRRVFTQLWAAGKKFVELVRTEASK